MRSVSSMASIEVSFGSSFDEAGVEAGVEAEAWPGALR